jgi:hypothetical protein
VKYDANHCANDCRGADSFDEDETEFEDLVLFLR